MFNLLFSLVNLSEQTVTALSNALNSFYPILYNGIGIISIFIQFMIFQMKRRKLIIFVGILSHIGWFSYFVLQGDFISGVSNVIGIISNLIFMFREKYRWANSKLWLFFFLAIAGVYSSLTFKVWKDIFPMIACLSSMLAFFMLEEQKIRKISLFTYTMFLCNSISKLYIVALVADITAIISVVLSLYRFKIKSEHSIPPVDDIEQPE